MNSDRIANEVKFSSILCFFSLRIYAERVREEVGASGGAGGLAGMRGSADAAAAGDQRLREGRLDAEEGLEGLSAHLQSDTAALSAHLRQQSFR